MPLTLEAKKAVVEEVAQVARTSHSVVAAEYRGLSVAQMTKLRVQARESGVYLKVVRNSLARRAFSETDFECMSEQLVGPLVLAFSREEPSSAARVVRDFAKENDKLVVRLASFAGKVLGPRELDVLANLPTREEGLSRLVGVMQAPIAKFVRTMAEPPAKFTRLMAAVRDQKQG